jgi:hypothetical protein
MHAFTHFLITYLIRLPIFCPQPVLEQSCQGRYAASRMPGAPRWVRSKLRDVLRTTTRYAHVSMPLTMAAAASASRAEESINQSINHPNRQAGKSNAKFIKVQESSSSSAECQLCLTARRVLRCWMNTLIDEVRHVCALLRLPCPALPCPALHGGVMSG